MQIKKSEIIKIIKEELNAVLAEEATYDKLPRIRTAGYKAYKMDQASADRRGTKTKKALMELPDVLTSVEQFLQWFNKYSGTVVSTDASDVLVRIATEDDRLSSKSIDRIEMIQRQLQQSSMK